MGYKMGMPSLKLNNAGVKSKSCGSFSAVSKEGLEEREGHDLDIDRERSIENTYTGYRTAAELMEYSRQHTEQLRDAKGRKLRADAVVMCATVLKPPAAYMNTLSPAEQDRLLDVAENVLAEAIGRENIKSTATHRDELGTHRHVFWEPMTPDGRLCAKEVHNLKFFTEINSKVPAALRAAGFDFDDCEMYDAAKEDYEAAKEKAGRSSHRFKAEAEQAKIELEKQITEKQGELDNLSQQLDSTSQSVKNARAYRRTVQGEINDLRTEKSGLKREIADLNEEVALSRDTKDTVCGEIDALRVEKDALQREKKGLEEELALAPDMKIAVRDRPLTVKKLPNGYVAVKENEFRHFLDKISKVEARLIEVEPLAMAYEGIVEAFNTLQEKLNRFISAFVALFVKREPQEQIKEKYKDLVDEVTENSRNIAEAIEINNQFRKILSTVDKLTEVQDRMYEKRNDVDYIISRLPSDEKLAQSYEDIIVSYGVDPDNEETIDAMRERVAEFELEYAPYLELHRERQLERQQELARQRELERQRQKEKEKKREKEREYGE